MWFGTSTAPAVTVNNGNGFKDIVQLHIPPERVVFLSSCLLFKLSLHVRSNRLENRKAMLPIRLQSRRRRPRLEQTDNWPKCQQLFASPPADVTGSGRVWQAKEKSKKNCNCLQIVQSFCANFAFSLALHCIRAWPNKSCVKVLHQPTYRRQSAALTVLMPHELLPAAPVPALHPNFYDFLLTTRSCSCYSCCSCCSFFSLSRNLPICPGVFRWLRAWLALVAYV